MPKRGRGVAPRGDGDWPGGVDMRQGYTRGCV